MDDTYTSETFFLTESQCYSERCWHFPGILIKGSIRAAEFVHIIVQDLKHIYMLSFQKSDGKYICFVSFVK